MVITDSGVLTSGIAQDAITVVPIIVPAANKRDGASLLIALVMNMMIFETIKRASAPPPKIIPRSFTDSGRKRSFARDSNAASDYRIKVTSLQLPRVVLKYFSKFRSWLCCMHSTHKFNQALRDLIMRMKRLMSLDSSFLHNIFCKSSPRHCRSPSKSLVFVYTA